MNYNRVDLERKAALYKAAAISANDYDQALAQFQQSQAAKLNSSLVSISQKNIRASFSRKIGIRQVNLGQYINAGDTLSQPAIAQSFICQFFLATTGFKRFIIRSKNFNCRECLL